MANSFASFLTMAVTDALDNLRDRFVLANRFTNYGTSPDYTVRVPRITAKAAVQKTDGTLLTISDTAYTHATLTKNQHWAWPFYLEMGETGMTRQRLAESAAREGIKQLIQTIDATCAGLYTDLTQSVGDYDDALTVDTLADAQRVLLEQNASPDFVVIDPVSNANLAKDAELAKILAFSGQSQAQTGVAPKLHGFEVGVSNQLIAPVAGQRACLAFDKSAFGIGFVDLGANADDDTPVVDVVVDSASGIPIYICKAARSDAMGTNYVLTCKFGVATIAAERAVLVKAKN